MLSVNYVKGTPNKIVKGDLDALLADKDAEIQRIRDSILLTYSVEETNLNPEPFTVSVENGQKSARHITINRSPQQYYDIQPTGGSQTITVNRIPVAKNLRLPALANFKVGLSCLTINTPAPLGGMARHQEITLYTGTEHKKSVTVSPDGDFLIGLITQYPQFGSQCQGYIVDTPKSDYDTSTQFTLVGNNGNNKYVGIFLPATRRLYCLRATAWTEGGLQMSRCRIQKRCVLFWPEKELGADSSVSTVTYKFVFGNDTVNHLVGDEYGVVQNPIAPSAEHRNNFYASSEITGSSEIQSAKTLLENDYIHGYYANGRNYSISFDVERIYDFSNSPSCLMLDRKRDMINEINS